MEGAAEVVRCERRGNYWLRSLLKTGDLPTVSARFDRRWVYAHIRSKLCVCRLFLPRAVAIAAPIQFDSM